jgi:polyhydroxyalkanoate synthesis regulator phasin
MKTMNGFVAIALTIALASGALASMACEKKSTLQKAGEKVDDVVDDVTHPGEGPVEEAARKAGEKVDDVKEDVSK